MSETYRLKNQYKRENPIHFRNFQILSELSFLRISNNRLVCQHCPIANFNSDIVSLSLIVMLDFIMKTLKRLPSSGLFRMDSSDQVTKCNHRRTRSERTESSIAVAHQVKNNIKKYRENGYICYIYVTLYSSRQFD